MTPKELVEKEGYVFLPSFFPHISPASAAALIGISEQVDGLRLLQELLPTSENVATPNTYSGNFGLRAFPLHTDLAHWARPPRYLMLRCLIGDPDVQTQFIDGCSLIANLGSNVLARCLAKPRRPLKGKVQLLPVLDCPNELQRQIIRWDSLYLRPSNAYSQKVFDQISNWLLSAQSEVITLLNNGDTLVLDNWRVLHGRSVIKSPFSLRKIQRLYLSSLI